MRVLRALLVLAAAWLAADAACAQTVTSEKPDSVSVSIYRATDRGADDPIELQWLGGYALITETRTVTIPQGRAVIRFEGVAGRILPESVIVTGLPEGVREKNMDADLLSEASLYARSLNRPVTIRRTVDGKQIEERAIIRSGADGAAIFETAQGFFAADCRRPEEIVYDRVPAGLSAKPTLSVETESPRSGRVRLTLSYLAWGYDWQANYVATMHPGGKTADLFAWVTLANGDVTSFDNAEAMVIAGRPNREDYDEPEAPEAEPLSFRCLALPAPEISVTVLPAPELEARGINTVAEALQRVSADGIGDIIVTGSLVRQENLGDFKLYRIPHNTTVASLSQKQVALLDQPSVPVEVVYRSRVYDDELRDEDRPVELVLRAQNRKEKGLGLPLPQGSVAVFEPQGGQRLLIGEGAITDKAIGEEVEVEMSAATQVGATIEAGESGRGWEEHLLQVSNANPYPVRYEAELEVSDSYRLGKASARLIRRKSRDVWIVEVPANGTAQLRYRLKHVD
ncbi:hypothetical protein [Sphingomonas sp.]|uniref:DUF4139 domain-containing protein n=1 Tax=Sphingomonas sp. TaxID=28214 RepID=UPI0025D44131|nr:hypothetical protein [Sphingomonas sp.]